MAEWNPKVNDIFVRAAQIESPADRRLFVEQQCEGDAALRAQVESLLVAGGQLGSFLNRPVVGSPSGSDETSAHRPLTEGPGTVIGPYKLLEQIGEGGMGEVWVADQLDPIKRRVALKLIKPGMDSRSVLARFEAERQALALMDHPNIARVLDAGSTGDGRPYFVMELVKGTPITQFCDARKLTAKERLELFVSVCQAIQHAHQKGIIHRDIKPSNVLVELHDDRMVPKVIDFGVVKAIGQQLTEKTIYTGFGSLVGTPTYMAPEQATFNALDIDTRADVYGLGVLLYELLVGSPPIEKERLKQAALDEVLRIVREEEPQRPSQRLSTSQSKATIAATRQSEPAKLSALMKSELDWIVMKALEKERARRYETAIAFAADVKRFLGDEPVEARPPSMWYRLRKFSRRNRVAVFLTVLLVSTVLAVAANHLMALHGIRRERDRAVEAEADAAKRLVEANHQRQRAENAEVEVKESLATATREKERAEATEADAQAVLAFFLSKVVAAARPVGVDGGMGHDVTVRAALKAAERDLEGAFNGNRKAEAAVRDTLGQNLIHLGEPASAILHLERAVKQRREEFGLDHPATHQSMHNLASAYLSTGQFDKAVPLLEDVVPRVRKSLPEDHPHYYRGLVNFAEALAKVGQYERARVQLEEAVVVSRRVLGINDPQTLLYQSKLGTVLLQLGQTDRAIKLTEDALERAKKLPPHDLFRLGITHSLAMVYHTAGKRKSAISLLEETISKAKALLPKGHQVVTVLMINLASTHADEGELDKAIPLFEELLTAVLSSPNGALEVPLARARLGDCYFRMKKYDKAEPVLKQAHDGLEQLGRNLPPAHEGALIRVLDQLETVCLAQGRKDEAAKWGEALERRRKAAKR